MQYPFFRRGLVLRSGGVKRTTILTLCLSEMACRLGTITDWFAIHSYFNHLSSQPTAARLKILGGAGLSHFIAKNAAVT